MKPRLKKQKEKEKTFVYAEERILMFHLRVSFMKNVELKMLSKDILKDVNISAVFQAKVFLCYPLPAAHFNINFN